MTTTTRTFDLGPDGARQLTEVGATGSQAQIKRVLDTAAAFVMLLLALPVMALIALAIKLTGRGPVLFNQERVGHNGALFTVLKFRTMRDGTHKEVLGCEKQRAKYAENDFKLDKDDPRITRVGRVLRASSFDELPQLFNVLTGDMSLVGVRPLLEDELAMRPRHDQACYCSMRPGLTGLWQVAGRSTVSHVDRWALDREYVENWSLWGDTKLLLRTPTAVLRVHRAQ